MELYVLRIIYLAPTYKGNTEAHHDDTARIPPCIGHVMKVIMEPCTGDTQTCILNG